MTMPPRAAAPDPYAVLLDWIASRALSAEDERQAYAALNDLVGA